MAPERKVAAAEFSATATGGALFVGHAEFPGFDFARMSLQHSRIIAARAEAVRATLVTVE